MSLWVCLLSLRPSMHNHERTAHNIMHGCRRNGDGEAEASYMAAARHGLAAQGRVPSKVRAD
eukprot:scaffold16761_cov142-Isochrysis_galbana.AAC.7